MKRRIQELLEHRKSDHDSLQRCVESFTNQKAWRNLSDQNGKPFTSYASFCKTRKPFGLGRDPAEINALLKEGAARKAAELAADPEVKPAASVNHAGVRVPTVLETAKKAYAKLDAAQRQEFRTWIKNQG
jgi:hypothetical protein